MQLEELIIIFLLPILVWFWFDSSKVKELARRKGFLLCKNTQVQFLDDTVHLVKLGMAKNSYGQLKIARTYAFEFTNNEYIRYTGRLYFAGHQLMHTYMDAYPTNEFQ